MVRRSLLFPKGECRPASHQQYAQQQQQQYGYGVPQPGAAYGAQSPDPAAAAAIAQWQAQYGAQYAACTSSFFSRSVLRC